MRDGLPPFGLAGHPALSYVQNEPPGGGRISSGKWNGTGHLPEVERRYDEALSYFHHKENRPCSDTLFVGPYPHFPYCLAY